MCDALICPHFLNHDMQLVSWGVCDTPLPSAVFIVSCTVAVFVTPACVETESQNRSDCCWLLLDKCSIYLIILLDFSVSFSLLVYVVVLLV